MDKSNTIILGAGMTGLAAGMVSGHPIFEATSLPGGICSSYYVKPNSQERLHQAKPTDEVYRFEIGGGHWIFGGDPVLNHFIRSITPLKLYDRISSVYFHNEKTYVPYPIQNHLSYLGKETARKALTEMATTPQGNIKTMADWLYQSFGKTLTDLFFAPFHESYTAGLWETIAPQDSYKSPVNLSMALQGAFEKTPPVGYNTAFLYPQFGLDTLSRLIAERCQINYQKKAVHIDPQKKEITFQDNTTQKYEYLISSLPLNKMMEMTGLSVDSPTNPHSSVLVLNIGAKRGSQCPNDHWLYNPNTSSGFHRVGFYSNVDTSFLPASNREKADRVSIYVERAFPGNKPAPTQDEIDQYANEVVKELQNWEFIEEAEVVDPTWIEIAYTWSWPGSNWKNQAISILQDNDIYPMGRYARWSFQGIANSFRDGFTIGSSFIN